MLHIKPLYRQAAGFIEVILSTMAGKLNRFFTLAHLPAVA